MQRKSSCRKMLNISFSRPQIVWKRSGFLNIHLDAGSSRMRRRARRWSARRIGRVSTIRHDDAWQWSRNDFLADQRIRNVSNSSKKRVSRSRQAQASRHSCPKSSSTAVVQGVSPSTPHPPWCSKRERPKDRSALQANKVPQRRNHACPTDSRSCVCSLLTREMSSLSKPSPPSSRPNTTRRALPPRGQANSGQVVSFFRRACRRAAPSWSPSHHLWPETQGLRRLRAVQERQSIGHDLDLPVIHPPWRKEIQISHADWDPPCLSTGRSDQKEGGGTRGDEGAKPGRSEVPNATRPKLVSKWTGCQQTDTRGPEEDSNRNAGMSFSHSREWVRPGGPIRSILGANGAPQTQSSKCQEQSTGELSLSPPCEAAPGCNATRSHHEQSRIAPTKLVVKPEWSDWRASQHKTTAEAKHWRSCTARILRNRTVCSSVLACNALAMQRASTKSAPKKTTPYLSVGKVWSSFQTNALGSATLAASEIRSPPGGQRPLSFQICVFPACNEIPARVHKWCPSSRCTIDVRSGSETKKMSSRKAIRHSVGCSVAWSATKELCCPGENRAGSREVALLSPFFWRNGVVPSSSPKVNWEGCPLNWATTGRSVSSPSFLRQPESIASLSTKWVAPFPSSDQTVLAGLRTVRAWIACLTHSVPERMARAYWTARCPDTDPAICCATALDTALLKVSSTTMPLARPWACAMPSSDPDGSLAPPQQAPRPRQTPQPSPTTSRCPEHCWGPPSNARWSPLKGLLQHLRDLAEHTSRTCPDPVRFVWRACVGSVPLEVVSSILEAF